MMNGSVQLSAVRVQSCAEILLQWDSNPGPHDPKSEGEKERERGDREILQ